MITVCVLLLFRQADKEFTPCSWASSRRTRFGQCQRQQ